MSDTRNVIVYYPVSLPVSPSNPSGRVAGEWYAVKDATAAAAVHPNAVILGYEGDVDLHLNQPAADYLNGKLEAIEAVQDNDGKFTAAAFAPQSVTRAALDASVGNAYIRTDRKWARSFLAALATVDTSPVDILVIGDSVTEGKTVSTIANRYVTQLQRELRRAYQPSAIAGGDGYFAATPSTVSSALFPWVLSGAGGSRAAVNLGLGRRGFRVQNSANTATLTFTGTGFRLLFTGYTGAPDISVSIDGGVAIAIPSASASTKPGMTWDSPVLTAGAHTAVFTIQPGSGFEGALIFNGDKDAGVRVWDGGHGGYAVADYISPNTGWQDSITAVGADLVLINLALNDWGAFQTDPAAWKTRMKDLISVIRTKAAATNPSIGIVIPYQRTSTSQVPVATWAAMVQAHYDLATEDGNLGVLDLDRYLGAMSGSGLMDGDGIHINDTGHRLFGQTLARLLIPSNA